MGDRRNFPEHDAQTCDQKQIDQEFKYFIEKCIDGSLFLVRSPVSNISSMRLMLTVLLRPQRCALFSLIEGKDCVRA